jgi:hypothetical protein
MLTRVTEQQSHVDRFVIRFKTGEIGWELRRPADRLSYILLLLDPVLFFSVWNIDTHSPGGLPAALLQTFHLVLVLW